MSFDLNNAKNLGYKEYFKDKVIHTHMKESDFQDEAVKKYFCSEFLSAFEKEDSQSIKELALILYQKYSNEESVRDFRLALGIFDNFYEKHSPKYKRAEDFIQIGDIKVNLASPVEMKTFFRNLKLSTVGSACFFTHDFYEKTETTITLMNNQYLLRL